MATNPDHQPALRGCFAYPSLRLALHPFPTPVTGSTHPSSNVSTLPVMRAMLTHQGEGQDPLSCPSPSSYPSCLLPKTHNLMGKPGPTFRVCQDHPAGSGLLLPMTSANLCRSRADDIRPDSEPVESCNRISLSFALFIDSIPLLEPGHGNNSLPLLALLLWDFLCGAFVFPFGQKIGQAVPLSHQGFMRDGPP